MDPHILACMEGYISTSCTVSSISFSKICATFCCLLLSSDGLQNLKVYFNISKYILLSTETIKNIINQLINTSVVLMKWNVVYYNKNTSWNNVGEVGRVTT